MTLYKSFRDRTALQNDKVKATGVDFIDKSLSSTTIYHLEQGIDITAVLTNSYKEGGDEWILFTKALEGGAAKNNIKKGDFFTNNEKTYMVYEEYNHPQINVYKKHRVIECNTTLRVNSVEQPAYFVSSLRSFSDLNISDFGGGVAFSRENPVIVTKDSSITKVGQKLIILGNGYEIRNVDRISNQGVAYLSVIESVMREDIDDISNNISVSMPEPQEVELGPNTLVAGDLVVIPTKFAYAVFTHKVDIFRKTANEIEFYVPLGIESLGIQTKNELGQIIDTLYEVVI